MLYRIQGSNNKRDWVTVDVSSSYATAMRNADYFRDASHSDYDYYRVSKPLPIRVVDFAMRPFVSLSKIFSYMSKPITAQELGSPKEKEDFESLDNYSTHVSTETRFVVARMFPVIIRLFESSGTYKKIILDSLDYMMEVTTKKFRDYPEVKGISGANVGIPFNLVVIKVCKIGEYVPDDLKGLTIKYKGYHFLHMINPKIVDHTTRTFRAVTNCGSIRLEKPITVERFKWVQVTFYTREGQIRRSVIERPITGTAQHEIDHNNGVLITDRKPKENQDDSA